jgi:hypothetical protein
MPGRIQPLRAKNAPISSRKPEEAPPTHHTGSDIGGTAGRYQPDAVWRNKIKSREAARYNVSAAPERRESWATVPWRSDGLSRSLPTIRTTLGGPGAFSRVRLCFP